MNTTNPIKKDMQTDAKDKSLSTQSLFRLDKNVAHNIRDFRAFDDDKQIVKALITYFAYKLQNDLFGYGTLDPTHFGKTMGFSPSYLRSKHPNPTCLKDLTKKEIDRMYRDQSQYPDHKEYRIFDSLLENALYILRYNRIRFTSQGTTFQIKGENLTKISLSEIQFITELSIVFKTTKSGQTKVIYTYRLADSFMNNISNYYLKSDTQSLKALRKPGLDELYLYLKNLMTTFALQDTNKGMSSFKLLCELAYINIELAPDRKKKLNQAFRRINEKTELNVTLNWHKGGRSKYAYTPEIEFDTEQVIELKNGTQIKEERNAIFLQNLNYELTQAYRREVVVNDVGQIIEPNQLLSWMKDKNTKELSLYFDLALVKTYKKLPEWHWKTQTRFFQALKAAKQYSDVMSF